MSEILVPTKEQFLKELFAINPVGNADMIYQIVLGVINKPLPTGDVLTFELLCKRYREYHMCMKPYNDVKDKQFIKKENVMRPIGQYIVEQLHISDMGATMGHPSDKYLFGFN